MMKAQTIDEVIRQLQNIIDWSIEKQSRIGYFATLYLKMTIAVKNGIANKTFEDAQRMERLDVIFANRYIDAWDAYINNGKCTNSWCSAFDACKTNSLIVLQHLVLGVNTHINLDLGIAAAETSPGITIFELERDFVKINDIIESLTQGVQDTLSNVWYPLRFLTKISNRRHEPLLNFSIAAARKASWANAVALSSASGISKPNYIALMDETVVKLANRIIHPGMAIKFILQPVRIMEPRDVRKIIEILRR